MKYFHFSILVFFCFLISSEAYAGKKVLHISSYNSEYPWTKNCTDGILEVLKKEYNFKSVYLNTKIILKEEFKAAAEKALDEYKRFKPDIVVIGDDNAMMLLGPVIANGKIPVVYYGVNGNPRDYFNGGIPDNVYGIIERPLIIPLYRYIEEMMPDLKSILVLFDKSISSEGIIKSAFYGKSNIKIKNVVFDIKVIEKWKDWKETIIIAEKKYQAVIIANHFTLKDSKGMTMNQNDVMRLSSKLSKIPVFAVNDYAVHSKGAVGAMVIEGLEHGRQTGEIVKSILEGNKKIAKHVVQKGGKIFFNKEQLKRYNLVLPPDISETVNFR